MSKKDKLENEIIDLDISIEEIDKEIEDFYIDRDKISKIEIPNDLDILIKKSIDRAESDNKRENNKKRFIYIAASVGIILSVGVYNPVLAHKVPPVKNFLQSINDTLQVDEIASFTGIDKYVPKAKLDEDGSIKFEVIKTTDYKVNKTDEDLNEELNRQSKENINTEDNNSNNQKEEVEEEKDVQVNNLYMPTSEYQSIQFIHEMSNGIITAVDDRKYGVVKITPENVDIGIKSLEYIKDSSVKSYLTSQLTNWKNGNFDNAVEVHNYVWNILGGEVGKAMAIKHDEVNKIKGLFK